MCIYTWLFSNCCQFMVESSISSVVPWEDVTSGIKRGDASDKDKGGEIFMPVVDIYKEVRDLDSSIFQCFQRARILV